MTLIIAIDVGVKNLGICAYSFLNNKVVFWDNVSLTPNGRYIPAQNVQYVRDFVTKHLHLFENAMAIVVERQMRCNMRIIEAVFQTMFFDRCFVVTPRSVKVHYNLSTRNYRTNKAKAVEWTQFFLMNNPDALTEECAKSFKDAKKQDDFADALLLVMYYLDTYSNQNDKHHG
mgnify:CR=1 FL=1|tara:strand:- start:3080 stop:3598 length:519 start_codon:yes stop_codon:yes gene_type:complete